MRYIKKFEWYATIPKFQKKLEIGDYIILKDENVKIWSKNYKGLFNCGRIIGGPNKERAYKIEVSLSDHKSDIFFLDKSFIERFATPEEIKELDKRLTIKKYNL